MNNRSPLERELGELVIAANSGEASDEQLTRLDALVRSDSTLANYTARLLDQQAALAWQGMLGSHDPPAPADQETAAEPAKTTAVRARTPSKRSTAAPSRWMWPSIAVGIGFILGGLTAAAFYSVNSAIQKALVVSTNDRPATQPGYEALLIHSTACRWEGNSTVSPAIGSGLLSGESLHLLEGLAEFNLSWMGRGKANLSLEGPAAMMLTSEGMPTLRFGRLSATIETSGRPFVLETPIGRLSLSDFGSIGVSAYGNEGEVHVFKGTATFEPAWRSPEQTAPLTIDAGQALHVQTADNGEPKTSWHTADGEYFAAQVSMNSDGLAIPPAYVRAIKESKPIGYWRFERSEWPKVRNEIGPQLACHVTGSLGRPSHQGNQSLEFGVSDKGGEFVSDEPVGDAIHDSYSVEFWVKPSHYHLGSVVSLVGDTPMPSGILPHGMLVELGGSGRIPTATHHPGCIRFLHRSPASNVDGTSCYSKTPYTLRKWQHVVATKEREAMRLYINGEMVAEGTDESPLPAGLRLLVGSLYPSRSERPFNGQLDELALYDRALTEPEIVEHYEVVRPKTASEPSI